MHSFTAQFELLDNVADLLKPVAVRVLLPHVVGYYKERLLLKQEYLTLRLLKTVKKVERLKIGETAVFKGCTCIQILCVCCFSSLMMISMYLICVENVSKPLQLEVELSDVWY